MTLEKSIVIGAFAAVVFLCIYWEQMWDWLEERRRRAARAKRSATADAKQDQSNAE